MTRLSRLFTLNSDLAVAFCFLNLNCPSFHLGAFSPLVSSVTTTFLPPFCLLGFAQLFILLFLAGLINLVVAVAVAVAVALYIVTVVLNVALWPVFSYS